MAEKALSVMGRHLEVLAGPLTVLSLADTALSQATREAMGKKLVELQDEWNCGAMPLRRASAPRDFVSREGIIGDDWQEVSDYIYKLHQKSDFTYQLTGWQLEFLGGPVKKSPCIIVRCALT